MPNIKIDQVVIGDRFRKDLGDIGSLAASMADLGLLQPIVIDQENRLIAGHRRLEAAEQLGWTEIPVNVINLADIVKGEVAENLIRKDFTASEIAAIKKALEPLEKAQAEERKKAGIPAAESDKGRVDDRIASAVGMSRDSLSKIETIAKAAEQDKAQYGEILEQVDRNELSINAAHQKVTGQTKPKREKKERQVKNFVLLSADLFDTANQIINEAHNNGDRNVVLKHDGHRVLEVNLQSSSAGEV